MAASGEGSSINGYLSRCKRGKRHWKKLWFVIKGKVLYTYTANEVSFGLGGEGSVSKLLRTYNIQRIDMYTFNTNEVG